MFSERAYRRLNDIVEDATDIAAFFGGISSVEAFAADRRTVLAVERLLQRIAEAVVQIGSEQMAEVEPSLPIARLRALGNRLRHEYWDLDPAMVLRIAREDVPALRVAVAHALGI